MFARVISGVGAPEKLDRGVDFIREQLRAAQGQVTGLQGIYLLIDRATGKHMTVSLFATREDAEAVATRQAQIRDRVFEAFGIIEAGTSEVFEVAIHP